MMTSGFTATTTKVYAAGSTLPTCTDPTGQNLTCMIVISTLPPPANALQCQESSGQILSCSYATQNLSNGQEVMVITVYVPSDFVFNPGVVKVVVHEAGKTAISKVIHVHCPPFTFCPPPVEHHTADFLAGYGLGSQDGSIGVYDLAAACAGKVGAALEHCYVGYKDAYVSACHQSKFGCGDGPTTCPPGESSKDCSVPQPEKVCVANSAVGGPNPCLPTPTPSTNPGCATPGPPCGSGSPLPLTSIPTPGAGKGPGAACAAGNCTSWTAPSKVDCTKNPGDPSCQQQQHHTAAYLQALNSGSPNPFKPGTKDYEHYQAGLDARQQSGDVTGPTTSTPSNPSSPSTSSSSPSNSGSSSGGTSSGGGSGGGSSSSGSGGSSSSGGSRDSSGGSGGAGNG